MKVPERNALIDTCISELATLHHEYFPRGDSMSDEKWEEVIHKMDEIGAKFKDSPIKNISGVLEQAFLDDIEEYDKKWRQYKENGKT